MKRWLFIILVACLSCVGQKDDPEPIPDPTPEEEGGEAEGSRFFHRVLALEFTGTWCQYCPNMSSALEDAKLFRPGRIVDIAVHCYDEFSPACSDDYAEAFNVYAFPTMVFDMDANTTFNRSDSSIMVSYVDDTVGQNACGLAMSHEDGTLTVKVKAVQSGLYRLVVAIVEDGLVADQVGYGPNYVNKSVLRELLVSDITGDSLGAMSIKEEKIVTFEAELTDNQRFVAYVLKDGVSQNALSCKPNESIPYSYEKESD